MIGEIISEALAEAIGTAIGEAIPSWFPQSGSKTGKYKVYGDTAVFRVHTAITVLGTVSVAISIAAVFIPDLFAKLFLVALFGALGLPLLLFGLVTRLYISPKEIVYRNPLGFKRQIMWREVSSVFIKGQGDILISSQHVKITVFAQFRGAKHIKALLKSFHPSFTFNETAPNSGDSKLKVRRFRPSKGMQ